MKFFLDTPNLDKIKEAIEYGVIDGITTNPSLIAKEGLIGIENIYNRYIEICNLINGPVSAEVIATDFEGMIMEGVKLASLHKNIVVKVPVTKDGIKAIKHLSSKGIKTNCTLIFTPGQALLAAKAGADYVSPFIGRLDDISQDGTKLVGQIVNMFNYYKYDTQVIAASLRSTLHIAKCIELGVHIATIPLEPILALLNHPLTEAGLNQFLNDYHKVNK